MPLRTQGVVGTRNLNNVLQQPINPPGANKVEITRGGMTLREGDAFGAASQDALFSRQTTTIASVFNGDVGFITNIDTEEQEVTVQYLECSVVYDYADLNEISLAFAKSGVIIRLSPLARSAFVRPLHKLLRTLPLICSISSAFFSFEIDVG